MPRATERGVKPLARHQRVRAGRQQHHHRIELAALRLVHRHGPGAGVRGQARARHGARRRPRAEPDRRLLGRQAHAEVAVVEPDHGIVGLDQPGDRDARARRAQARLDPGIESARPAHALAQCAQHPEARHRLERDHRIAGLEQRRVTFAQCGDDLRARRRGWLQPLDRARRAGLQAGADARHVAGADRIEQRAETAVRGEAMLARQVHHVGIESTRHVRRHHAGRGRAQPFRLRRWRPALAVEPGQRREHRAALHRRQLVRIADQDQPRRGRHGIDQARHHRQVDHRALVDDQGIERQRVRRVMLRAHAESTLAQQAVQRGRGNRRRERPQRLGEPRRRLAGRRGKPDAERRSETLAPQPHHARDGPGLASARSAAQHQQAPIQRQRQRHALPVERVVGGLAQQRGDAPRVLRRVAMGRAFTQHRREPGLVVAIASQVEAPATVQHQRQARVGVADEGRAGGGRAQGRCRRPVGIATRQRIRLVQVEAGVALRHGTQGEAGQGQVRRRRVRPAARQRALQRLRGILGRMGAGQRNHGHGCSALSSKARSRASTSATGGRSRCTPRAPSRDMPRRNRYSAPPR